ncbi:MAG: hypothetical protein J6Y62_07095 [Clostridia bacterium]|nr:hypothetical protein [Clostridia bacterium]
MTDALFNLCCDAVFTAASVWFWTRAAGDVGEEGMDTVYFEGSGGNKEYCYVHATAETLRKRMFKNDQLFYCSFAVAALGSMIVTGILRACFGTPLYGGAFWWTAIIHFWICRGLPRPEAWVLSRLAFSKDGRDFEEMRKRAEERRRLWKDFLFQPAYYQDEEMAAVDWEKSLMKGKQKGKVQGPGQFKFPLFKAETWGWFVLLSNLINYGLSAAGGWCVHYFLTSGRH